jgi:hypothetical protein
MATEIKQQIKQLQEKKRNLSWYHPGDDDPTGEFYTVREQRRSISDKINRLKEL